MALSPAERAKRWRDKKRTENPLFLSEKRKEHYQRNKDYWVKWQKENPEKVKLSNKKSALKRKRCFSLELYEQCFEFQNGLCAICGRTIVRETHRIDSIQADHDHLVREPRGLLCVACNTGLGYYEKHQRQVGLLIEVYETYLSFPPVKKLQCQ